MSKLNECYECCACCECCARNDCHLTTKCEMRESRVNYVTRELLRHYPLIEC